jgi:hypothetical protein
MIHPFAETTGERIGADHKPACPQLGQVCEDAIEVALRTGIEDMKL